MYKCGWQIDLYPVLLAYALYMQGLGFESPSSHSSTLIVKFIVIKQRGKKILFTPTYFMVCAN
jgi:hypothetical protein